MSETNYYQPHVTINGRRLAEHAQAGSIVAIADFTIKWGVDDWYSDHEGATLTLHLLDPNPYPIAFETMAGQSIRITRDPDDTIVFEGTIDEINAERARITDPDTGQARRVWRYTITAYDPLAGLARDRRRGPTYYSRAGANKRLHWGPCTMPERREDLDARLPSEVEWRSTLIDDISPSESAIFWPVSAYELQATVSLLTVLHQTARIANPYFRPFYDLATGRFVFLAPHHSLSDYWDPYISPGSYPGEFRLGSRYDDGVTLLAASDFEPVDGIRASSTALEQATQLELVLRTEDWQGPGTEITSQIEFPENFVAVPRGEQRSQMTIKLETDMSSSYYTQSGAWLSFATATEEIIGGIYRAPVQSPVRYRFPKTRLPADKSAHLAFLLPQPPMRDAPGYLAPRIYFFVASEFHAFPGSGGVCFMGGELSYTNRYGWEALLTPLPAPMYDEEARLGDITITAPISSCFGESTVADWTKLTTARNT